MSKKTAKKMAPHPSQVFAQKGSGAEVDKLDEALTAAFADGYRAGMMRAHAEAMKLAAQLKPNSSQLSAMGVERLAWAFHNLSKDPAI